MENISQVYIGVDISKDHLDVCIHPLGRSLKIKNSEADIAKLAQELKSYTVASIGCEATGGYEKLLVKTLQDHSYNVWIIDPRRVKGFIVATKLIKLMLKKLPNLSLKIHEVSKRLIKVKRKKKCKHWSIANKTL